MTSRDFVYWLQGFFEISEAMIQGVENDRSTTHMELSAAKVRCIKSHLAMVFVHEIDPSHGDKAHQEKLSQAHGGGAAKPKPFQRSSRSGGKPPRYKC